MLKDFNTPSLLNISTESGVGENYFSLIWYGVFLCLFGTPSDCYIKLPLLHEIEFDAVKQLLQS